MTTSQTRSMGKVASHNFPKPSKTAPPASTNCPNTHWWKARHMKTTTVAYTCGFLKATFANFILNSGCSRSTYSKLATVKWNLSFSNAIFLLHCSVSSWTLPTGQTCPETREAVICKQKKEKITPTFYTPSWKMRKVFSQPKKFVLLTKWKEA